MQMLAEILSPYMYRYVVIIGLTALGNYMYILAGLVKNNSNTSINTRNPTLLHLPPTLLGEFEFCLQSASCSVLVQVV